LIENRQRKGWRAHSVQVPARDETPV
jgi:hypothetical protein